MKGLKRLELVNNKIEQMDGLENCVSLEYLNIGQNNITNIQKLQHNLLLSELICYSNKIESIPKNFSLPVLKLLKINGNEIIHFKIGY